MGLSGLFNRKKAAVTEEKTSSITSVVVSDEKESSQLRDVESLSSGNSVDSKNPFKDPAVAEHYRKVYEDAQYECRHLFDPDFEWEPEEERKLLWRLDFKVTLLACFMFIALQIDRANIKQAITDNMLEDLGLTTDDYNTGNLIFKAAFLAAELPSGIISKALGPDIWLPIQMIAWSITAMCQVALSGKKSFFATRALIAALEGGFIPDIVLWLSYFYKSGELTNRLSLFWTSLSICDIGIALVAFGLLRLRGVNGLEGWRWLFLLEGLVSLLISIAAAFLMVPSAAQTKKPWNKKGWFNEREEKIVVNRVLRDDPSKGDMHNRQALSWKAIKDAFLDYDIWPIYLMGFTAFAAYNTVGAYITIVLKDLGFNTFVTNVLVIPNNVLHIITLLGVTWLSERVDERSLVCFSSVIWQIPLLAFLRWWPGSLVNKWGTWAIVTLILGAPYVHAINVGWCSRNSNTVRTRSISAAVYNMFVQAAGMYGAQIYRKDDAPLYKRGNIQLFGIIAGYGGLVLLSKAYYIWRNKTKEAKWSVLTEEEKIDYLNNTTDEGAKRLDFRFAH